MPLFLAAVVIVGAALPSAAESSVPTIAVLTPGPSYEPALQGLREGLNDLGYHEGIDMRLVVEDTHGDILNLGAQAAKLVATKPAVVFTLATAPSLAAKQATQTIPIVFSVVADPIQSNLVPNFASSRSNITGVSSYASPLAGKRLELLREIAPNSRTVLAIVSTKEKSPQVTFGFLEQAAKKMAVQIVRRDVANPDDLKNVLSDRFSGRVDAIFYVPSVLVASQMESLIVKAAREKIPLAVNEESMVRVGALTSYGGDYRLLGIQAAKLVAKILKGVKPSQIPVETPDKFVFAVNLTTARNIGLKIPREVLQRADRLLE
jgi:putative ABC transport system substrate-binding protein